MKYLAFEAGWRNLLGEPSFTYSAELGADLLVLQSKPVMHGRDVANIYFSIREQSVRLIRLENAAGEAVANNPDLVIGVPLTAETPNDFAALLDSPRKDDVLAALVTLSGKRSTQPAIQQRLQRLSESAYPWIRQAAQLAK